MKCDTEPTTKESQVSNRPQTRAGQPHLGPGVFNRTFRIPYRASLLAEVITWKVMTGHTPQQNKKRKENEKKDTLRVTHPQDLNPASPMQIPGSRRDLPTGIRGISALFIYLFDSHETGLLFENRQRLSRLSSLPTIGSKEGGPCVGLIAILILPSRRLT
jgi:hypothetical protein